MDSAQTVALIRSAIVILCWTGSIRAGPSPQPDPAWFAMISVASSSVIAQHYQKHRHQDLLRFLKLIDAAVSMG
jgi:hypothetical protein